MIAKRYLTEVIADRTWPFWGEGSLELYRDSVLVERRADYRQADHTEEVCEERIVR